MKKKFITKLILSGAALAASAATLVSTTYAWYVQNTQVTATGVSGAVKDKDASSIFISKDYDLTGTAKINAANWLPSVQFESTDFVNAFKVVNNEKVYDESAVTGDNVIFNGGLDPITLDAALPSGKFVDVNGYTKVTVANPTNANAFVYKAEARVLEFNLYVRSNVNTTIRPYLIINNKTTADTATTQTAFRNIENGNDAQDVNQGDQFWIDAVQALRMQVIVQSDPNGETPASDEWTPVDGGSNGIYDVLKIARSQFDLTYTNPNDNDHYYRYSPLELSGIKSLVESRFAEEEIYTLSRDASVDVQKTYYTRNEYTAVADPTGNPNELGYYEKVNNNYVLTEDITAGAKTYYTHTTSYTQVASPSGTPNQQGYYEKATLKGANAYYKALTGNTPTGTFAERATTAGVTDVNTTTIEKDTAYKFTFRIWLEGTDLSCYDSCSTQEFDISVNFDVVA